MLRLAVRVRRAEAELVLAELLELAPDGVEEVDVGKGTVEYAIYGAPGELPELPALQAVAGAALVDVLTSEVADDWADRWREFHRPLVLGDRLSVRPPWEPPQGTHLDLVIDPGRAFGTGAHPTTRLCLELLLELEPPTDAAGAGAGGQLATGFARASGRTVIDLGCGSGVLAIAAAKLGWLEVLALDHDQLAIDATLQNAAANGVRLDRVERFELRDQRVPAAWLVLANLLAPPLLRWAARMHGARQAELTGRQPDERPQQLISSGLRETEADPVSRAFALAGYVELRRLVQGEWAALLLELRVASEISASTS